MKKIAILFVIILGIIILSCNQTTQPGGGNDDPPDPPPVNYNDYWVGNYSGTFELTEHEYGVPNYDQGNCTITIAHNGTNHISVHFRPEGYMYYSDMIIRGDVTSVGSFYAEEEDGDEVAALNKSGNTITGTFFDTLIDAYGSLIFTRNFSINVIKNK